ncbi:MAG TPA: amidohydrolase family protein [Nitrososphaeraceae archaeon]|nr:amidohydrolase family protein [Nitrososphaeraceae archaeon]
MIIKGASILLGRELTFVNQGFIEISSNGIIANAGSGKHSKRSIVAESTETNSKNEIINAEEFLVIPGFINAHMHIGDSIGKDIGVQSGLEARVHPIFGIKQSILKNTRPEYLRSFIRNSAISMIKKGITAFADFREGGEEGVRLLRDSISDLPIKCVVLGRVESYFHPKKILTIHSEKTIPFSKQKNAKPTKTGGLTSQQLQHARRVLLISDGLGLSGANENSDASLEQYHSLIEEQKNTAVKSIKRPLLSIHAAESRETSKFSIIKTGKTEVERIMQYLKPDFIVHMTNAADEDFALLASHGCGIVICPRANGVIGVGLPRVAKMLKTGCTIAIGTDNVMLNSPDVLREMDYIWKVSRASEKEEFLNPLDILKFATVNGADLLGLNSGYIAPGRAADLVFIDKRHIDLYPIHNAYASIVHRVSQDSIRAVMINGKFVDVL